MIYKYAYVFVEILFLNYLNYIVTLINISEQTNYDIEISEVIL